MLGFTGVLLDLYFYLYLPYQAPYGKLFGLEVHLNFGKLQFGKRKFSVAVRVWLNRGLLVFERELCSTLLGLPLGRLKD